MSQDFFIELLTFSNENLTAASVILAASMLLYNLARNVLDRVTRASAILLGCVTITYAAESIAGLQQASLESLQIWYRLQWIGIAFMPAAMFHLANALLSTTGDISRIKRRTVVRLLYGLSAIFTLLAAFSSAIINELVTEPVPYLRPGWLFPLYTAYFIAAALVSMQLMARARRRCLTTNTRRRMTLLWIVFLTPGLGIFPYSSLFASLGSGPSLPLLPLLVVFNLANFLVLVMLVFLAYPLSFFGTTKPDRLVKTELIQFLLRGPLTAIVLLVAMVTIPRVSSVLGVKSQDFVIVGVITLLLSLQWGITLLLPRLEMWLIYDPQQAEATQLRQISERLMTRADSNQLQEAILAAVCNQLRVPTAFIASLSDDGTHLQQIVGELPPQKVAGQLAQDFERDLPESLHQEGGVYRWDHFWLFPLHTQQNGDSPQLLGVLGVWAHDSHMAWTDEEQEDLYQLIDRAAQALADARLQAQVMQSLTDFAADLDRMRQVRGVSRYGHIQKETLDNSEAFVEWVRGALRDFWGGPKLSQSELAQLQIVQEEQQKQQTGPSQALQSVIKEAIERLKPPGERNINTPEWIIYNILEQRFLQGKKVRDVANILFMTESDFYRKQKTAIEEVAKQISEMERARLTPPPSDMSI
jgi:GAF domain-containing protein